MTNEHKIRELLEKSGYIADETIATAIYLAIRMENRS